LPLVFRGSIPADLRSIVGEIGRHWSGHAWVGCSGNMTLERVLHGLGTGVALHSNDVTGYTSALGWYFAGEPLVDRFTLKPDSAELMPWLPPYLTRDVDIAATLMLGTRFLTYAGKPGRFYRRQMTATADQFPRMHAATVTRLEDSPLRLASYHPMDVRAWLTGVVPAGDPVAMFPPFYGGTRDDTGKARGDYEVQFAGIDTHFDWPAPTYPELDEAGKDDLLTAVADRPDWVLGLHVRRPELDGHLRGMVQTANRGVPIYVYAQTAHTRIVRPRQTFQPIGAPKLGPDEDLGNRMTLLPLTPGQFSMIRSQFMAKTILPGHPLLACAVLVDGKVIGAFAYSPPKFDPVAAYLLSDFPVSWTKYRRLSKLIVIAALSAEAQLLIQRSLSRRMTHASTTAFSDHPNSAKYGRGIPGFGLTHRGDATDGLHRWMLTYRGPLGQWTLTEGLDLWRRKHAADLRADQAAA
jgi:hypothetical protein